MSDIYFASGVRTPFSKVDDALAAYDAIELSVPVVQAMAARLKPGARPDLAVWGSVVQSLSRVQIGLNQKLSDWLRHFLQARSLGARLETFSELHWNNIRLHIPAIVNRTTGRSMGEHTEDTAKEWHISR